MRGLCFLLAAVGAWVLSGQASLGQTRAPTSGGMQAGAGVSTGTTSQGLFGSRSVGSSLAPGARTLGGTGSLGGTGGVGTGMGAAGATGQTLSGGLTGNERFLQRGFVGNDAADVAGFFGALTGNTQQTGTRGMTGLQQTNRGGQFNQNQFNQNQGNRGGGGGGTNTQMKHRTTYTAAFEVTRPAPAAISAALSQRFAGLSRIQSVTPVDVVVENRVAILRGTVATAHDRRLAEQLVRLEPGISQVQNELTVAEAAAEEPLR